MRNKDKVSSARKMLYGLMTLALVLSAFGILNVPVVSAQAATTGTLSGAIVSLSADKASFGTTEDVILRVTITNPNGYSINVLKWLTPVNGVQEPLFTVTRDGQPVAYLGLIAKRAAPNANDYVALAAGESLTRDVNLSTYYDFSASGNYAVKYNVASADLYGGQSKTTDGLTSNLVALSVAGRSAPVLQEVLPQSVSGTTSFISCSGSQQSALVSARDAASTYANNAVSYFSASKQGARYTTWFGVFDAGRYSLVASHYNNIRNATDNAAPMTFDCTCNDVPSPSTTYAYVFPNQPYTIHLCDVFWSSPTSGTDSQAGTLIHEISHFTIVAGTSDFVYGQSGAKALAISNPANATMNADNHEYFAENNPPLESVPYTFGDVPDTYWAWNYVERLFSAGITGGCGTGIYCPDSAVTRAQMAVFLLKGMHGSGFNPPDVGGSTGFTDVATTYWAAAWIKQLAAEGITSGCGGGAYCPDATVTRAQMAVFLLKAKYGIAFDPSPATGVFTDVPVGYWADKWIERLASDGITSGCGPGVYCPDSAVTRAQMAVFLVINFNLP